MDPRCQRPGRRRAPAGGQVPVMDSMIQVAGTCDPGGNKCQRGRTGSVTHWPPWHWQCHALARRGRGGPTAAGGARRRAHRGGRLAGAGSESRVPRAGRAAPATRQESVSPYGPPPPPRH